MTYQPKSEDQLAKEGLLPDGEYDFEVQSVSDKPSKAGNDMVTLSLRVFAGDGTLQYITDYISFGSNFGERKWRRAADSCGLLDLYDAGTLTASDFQDRAGKVKVKTQEAQGTYEAKNVVAEYVKRAADAKPVTAKQAVKDIEGDPIPF